MCWYDLLFCHWPVPAAALRAHIPAPLALDTFDGTAWIGVVPFSMLIRPRCTPVLPRLSLFPELNVRTYVSIGGKPGVWFFSLDAASRLAVRGARRFFHLPYFDARMAARREAGLIRYSSLRTHRGAPQAAFRGVYQPAGPSYTARPGTLEAWLTERYCLYAADRRGRIWRGDIHHQPWPLQPALADIELNTMTQQIGLALPDTPPLLHFAASIDVAAWPLEYVTAGEPAGPGTPDKTR